LAAGLRLDLHPVEELVAFFHIGFEDQEHGRRTKKTCGMTKTEGPKVVIEK